MSTAGDADIECSTLSYGTEVQYGEILYCTVQLGTKLKGRETRQG